MCTTKNSLKRDIQYLLPKHIITRLVGLLASAKLGKFTTFMIEKFIKYYDINTNEMAQDIESYQTFNEFFARALKENARPIDQNENSVVYPADGTISQFGKIDNSLLIQAKNHLYTVDALLAEENNKSFEGGNFVTIYLSPKDYHRVHIPFAGTLSKMTYVPGELFSVNPFNAENIPELFSRNERVVCHFNTAQGKMVVVFVGATIVRSISTAWSGVVTPGRFGKITGFDYPKDKFNYAKGDEIGSFSMGSTVICLFEKDFGKFNDEMTIGNKTKVGEKMGTIKA